MTPPRETPGQDAEVLAAGRPRRIGPLLAAVVVLALVGWLAVREDAPAPVSPRSAPPGLATSEPVPSEPAPSALDPSLDQLVFVDPVRAVAVRSDCTVSLGTTTCDRTLLVSDDAGTTFQDRGRLPVQAPYLLLADRAGAIALLDEALSRLVRTLDGGESWAETPVTQGPPAPIPAGVPALSGPVGDCSDRCGELVWIDLLRASAHSLPADPGGADGGVWYAAPRSGDGLLAAANALGMVAVSSDAGRSWTRSALPVDPGAGRSAGKATVLPGRDGRLYAFLDVLDRRGMIGVAGFRSDDAGRSWTDIGYPSRPVDGVPPFAVPEVVLDGELLTTNTRDGVLLSRAGGTAFAEIPGTPEEVSLSQQMADGPVLASGFQDGRRIYWLSRDGRTWTPLRLPAD